MAAAAEREVEADGDVGEGRRQKRKGCKHQRTMGAQRAVETRGDETVGAEAREPGQSRAIAEELDDDQQIDRRAPHQKQPAQGKGRHKMRPVARRQAAFRVASEIAKGEIGERRHEAREDRQERQDRGHAISPTQPDQERLHRIKPHQQHEETIAGKAFAPLQQEPDEKGRQKQRNGEGQRYEDHGRRAGWRDHRVG